MSAALLKKMHDMGLTMEQAIELMETWEEGSAKPVPELSKAALRTRKWREKQEQASRGDVTVTPTGDVTPTWAGAPVVLAFSSSLRSEEVGGGGVERASAVSTSHDDWPVGKASDHADELVRTVASPWLDPTKSPDLITTRGRVAAWKRDGASWEHDVLPVVTGLCSNRRSRVASWKFFDDAISRSIAANRAALEIPEHERPARGQGPPVGLTSQIAAEHAEARRRALES